MEARVCGKSLSPHFHCEVSIESSVKFKIKKKNKEFFFFQLYWTLISLIALSPYWKDKGQEQFYQNYLKLTPECQPNQGFGCFTSMGWNSDFGTTGSD